jgi:outer membrane biosynthesis protein TonB
MNYSDDRCMTEFTADQFLQMRATYATYRELDVAPTPPTPPTPTPPTPTPPTPTPPTPTPPTPTPPPPTPPTPTPPTPTPPTPTPPTPTPPTPTPPTPTPPTPSSPNVIVAQNSQQYQNYLNGQAVVDPEVNDPPPVIPPTTCRGRRDDGIACSRNWQCCSRSCNSAGASFSSRSGVCVTD